MTAQTSMYMNVPNIISFFFELTTPLLVRRPIRTVLTILLTPIIVTNHAAMANE